MSDETPPEFPPYLALTYRASGGGRGAVAGWWRDIETWRSWVTLGPGDWSMLVESANGAVVDKRFGEPKGGGE